MGWMEEMIAARAAMKELVQIVIRQRQAGDEEAAKKTQAQIKDLRKQLRALNKVLKQQIKELDV